MMFEKKCTVEPQDIIAVEFECRNCGASSSVPIQKVLGDELARFAQGACRYCGKDNGFAPDTQELQTLKAFVETTAAMAKTMQGRNMKLKLGIHCAL